jgi:hypothetical protein
MFELMVELLDLMLKVMKSPKTEDVSVASEELSSRRAQLLSSLKTFIVILSSSIISFIAFRNTLTWYLTQF